MYIARILYPVRVLGPGNRIGLWVSGCRHGCAGCSNPELWPQKPDQQIAPDQLSGVLHRIAAQHPVDGITVTGGEPFDQCEELRELLRRVGDLTQDVLIYTGYTLAELTTRHDDSTDAVLRQTAVLIDGRYVQSLNTGLPLLGSANQQIHYLKPAFRDTYEAYLQKPDHGIQNFTLGNSVVSVGIHRAEYAAQLPGHTARKGLIIDE